MKVIVYGIIFGLLFFPLVALAGQVRIYDEDTKEYIMADKMDCRVHKSKSGVTLGLKGGNFLFSFGPEITLGGEAKIKWEEAVQALVVRYEELCSRFNTGLLSKQEYEKRLEQINNISKEAFEFQEAKLKKVRDRAKDAFKDLDKETGRGGDEEVERTIVIIAEKVEALKPIEEVKESRPSQKAPKIEVIEMAPQAPVKLVEKAEPVFENDLIRVTVKSFQKSRGMLILEVWYENLTEDDLTLISSDWGSAYSTDNRGTYLLNDTGERWLYKEDTQIGNHYGGTELIPHRRLLNKIIFAPEGSGAGTEFTYTGQYRAGWKSASRASYQQNDIKVIIPNIKPEQTESQQKTAESQKIVKKHFSGSEGSAIFGGTLSKFPQEAYKIEVGELEIKSTDQNKNTAKIAVPLIVRWNEAFIDELRDVSSMVANEELKLANFDELHKKYSSTRTDKNSEVLCFSRKAVVKGGKADVCAIIDRDLWKNAVSKWNIDMDRHFINRGSYAHHMPFSIYLKDKDNNVIDATKWIYGNFPLDGDNLERQGISWDVRNRHSLDIGSNYPLVFWSYPPHVALLTDGVYKVIVEAEVDVENLGKAVSVEVRVGE